MNEQDMRAVESLCSCGLDFEGVCKSFPEFPIEEIKNIFIAIHNNEEEIGSIIQLKMNC